MKTFPVFFAILILACSNQAIAYTVWGTGSRGNAARLTTGLLLLQDDYDQPGNFEVSGDLLLLGYQTAINPRFRIGGGAGVLFDGKLGETQKNGGGDGFRIFVEGDYNLYRSGLNEIIGNLGLTHERYKFDKLFDLSMNATAICLGGNFVHRLGNVSFYAGLDLYLYSGGEIEAANISQDIERDQKVGLRLGLNFTPDSSFDLKVDLRLVGQQNLLIAGDFKI